MSYLPIFFTVVNPYNDKSSNYRSRPKYKDNLNVERLNVGEHERLNVSKDDLLIFIEKKRKFDERMNRYMQLALR